MQINIAKNPVDRMRIFFHMLLPRSCPSNWYQWLRIWLSRNIRFVGVNVGMSARNRHFQTNYWCITVSAEIVSYSYFYWKKYDCNWVTKLRSRYYCNMSRIRPRLIRCHWSFDPWWVKISGHSEQLGPYGSTSHFVNNRHSKVKTRGAPCIGGFG